MNEVKFAPADKVENIFVIFCEKCPYKKKDPSGWAYICSRLNKSKHPGNFCMVSRNTVGSQGNKMLHLFID